MIRIGTRDMGTVAVAPGQVVEFVSPILGFEEFRRFAIIPVPGAAPFHVLQSIEETSLAFPVVEAGELDVSYAAFGECPGAVGAASWDEVACWIIVVMPTEDRPLRLNLSAPILVNRTNRHAAQVIVNDGRRTRPASIKPGKARHARTDTKT